MFKNTIQNQSVDTNTATEDLNPKSKENVQPAPAKYIVPAKKPASFVYQQK